MGFLSKPKQIITQVYSSIGEYMSWGTPSAPVLSPLESLQNTAVLCAVKVVTDAMIQAPFRLIEKKEGSLAIATNHPLHSLVSKRPNSWMRSSELIEWICVQMMLGQGALLIKSRNAASPTGYDLLPVPFGWTIEPQEDDSVRYLVRIDDGTTGAFPASQVVFIKGMSLDGYSGHSALKSARKALGVASALEDQQLQLAAQGGMPSGVVTFTENLSPETVAKFKEKWKSEYAKGGGGIQIFAGVDAKFEPIPVSLSDSQFIESRKFQIEEIARIFKIRPYFLMAGSEKVTADEAFRMLTRETLMPYMKRIEDAFNHDLLNNADNLYFDFDEKELLRGDPKAQADYFAKALGSGGSQAWLAVNEIREQLGLFPINEDWAKVPAKGGYAAVSGMIEEKPKTEDNPKDEGL